MEKRKFSRIPIKKQNINWDELLELTDKIVASIVKDRYDDEDNYRWVYEQILITIYGYYYF